METAIFKAFFCIHGASHSPNRKAFLEKMAAAERNAAQIVEKTLASYSKISKKHVKISQIFSVAAGVSGHS